MARAQVNTAQRFPEPDRRRRAVVSPIWAGRRRCRGVGGRVNPERSVIHDGCESKRKCVHTPIFSTSVKYGLYGTARNNQIIAN